MGTNLQAYFGSQHFIVFSFITLPFYPKLQSTSASSSLSLNYCFLPFVKLPFLLSCQLPVKILPCQVSLLNFYKPHWMNFCIWRNNNLAFELFSDFYHAFFSSSDCQLLGRNTISWLALCFCSYWLIKTDDTK